MHLAIDGGIRWAGVALFNMDATLFRAGLVRNPCKTGQSAHEVGALADAVMDWIGTHPIKLYTFEWPRVYPHARQEGDQNDLFPLLAVSAMIAGRLPRGCKLVRYFPHEWKGQVPKETMNARTLSRLSPDELAQIEPAGKLSHNIHDAIGIGLHHTGRLARARVIAR